MAIYATDRATMSHWKFSGPDTHALYGQAELQSLILRGGFRADEVSIRAVLSRFSESRDFWLSRGKIDRREARNLSI